MTAAAHTWQGAALAELVHDEPGVAVERLQVVVQLREELLAVVNRYYAVLQILSKHKTYKH